MGILPKKKQSLPVVEWCMTEKFTIFTNKKQKKDLILC